MVPSADAATTVRVLGEFRHDVLIGAGLLARLPERLRQHQIPPASRVLAVVDSNVIRHAEVVLAALRSAGYVTSEVILRATEEEKSIDAVSAIWTAGLSARLSRRDVMVVIGGGLVGDVGGFAASSFLRGVRLIAVPTTLLAMVDASTGGKTGINLHLPDGSLGKNLAGAFWPPVEVIADPTTLSTLPPREFASGLAECVKHAFIDHEEHVAWMESHLDAIRAGDLRLRTELVAKSVAVKARVVTEDPREQGLRAVLNFGHTFGHALETLPSVNLAHGEAVALGMVAACVAGEEARGLSPRITDRLRALLDRAGLPTRVSTVVNAGDVERRMGFDKKVEGGVIRFVIPARIGEIHPKVDLSPRIVRAALEAIGCTG